MKIWNRHLERRSIQPDPGESRELPLWGAYSDYCIAPLQALAIADVWAAVRVLADAASSLPLHVYRKRATSGSREHVVSGKLVDLLDRPGPGRSQADLVSTVMVHLLLHGSGYIAKYGQGGEIVELDLIHPDRIRPERQGLQLRYRYNPPKGPQRMLTPADVCHVKGLSVDGLTGLSAVTQAARVLGLSDKLVRHALSFFEKGATRPAAIFRMAPDATEEQRKRWQEVLKNENSPHQTLVAPADSEYEPIEGKLDDSQFVEQRRLAAQEVARVFRLPPHMLGAPSADSMTYSNVEQESIEFVRYSLTPWLRRIELAISNDADLAFQQQYVKFETDGLLRADAKTRAEVYTAALDPITGWLRRDEVRRLEDLEPEPPTTQPNIEQMLGNPQGVGTNGN
jgi:HK97 family phage portal protein